MPVLVLETDTATVAERSIAAGYSRKSDPEADLDNDCDKPVGARHQDVMAESSGCNTSLTEH